MSEVKDDEEMVEQSSSLDSSDDEQLIETEVEAEGGDGVEESPEAEENQNLVENGEPLGVAEAREEDKSFESDGAAQLSGKIEEDSLEPLAEDNNGSGSVADAVNETNVEADGRDEVVTAGVDEMTPLVQSVDGTNSEEAHFGVKAEEERDMELKDGDGNAAEVVPENGENGVREEALSKQDVPEEGYPSHADGPSQSFYLERDVNEDDESGSEDDQAAFMRELENFFKERSLEFKPPKFYGEGLNCLKLWRGVTRLGGYDRVTACKLWRQVGESFKPPKTCTTVSWSFRIFYEKALLDYERHKMHGGELHLSVASPTEPMSAETPLGGQSAGSGRARRDAAARAMQGWHSQRLLGNGEVGDPIIKDKSSVSLQKREKPLKSVGLLKRKKPSSLERIAKAPRTITKVAKPQMDTMVLDVGPPADWVKINVRKTKDCFEVYALVPGLLREEVRVQSDPAGRLVISGDPEQPDNPWGVTPFKKVISLPSRIDPHQTSAVVTLHGQLFVRVPFEQSDL